MPKTPNPKTPMDMNYRAFYMARSDGDYELSAVIAMNSEELLSSVFKKLKALHGDVLTVDSDDLDFVDILESAE